jgi:hypothetical protein
MEDETKDPGLGRGLGANRFPLDQNFCENLNPTVRGGDVTV